MKRLAGYGKVPKHASIACRQQADFVGRRKNHEKKKRKKEEKIKKKLGIKGT